MTGIDEIYDEVIDKIATPKARLILIELLKKEGTPQAVIKACNKVLEIYPEDITIRRFLAETYFEQGSLELAEKELEKISRNIDELASVFKFQAELFRKENRIEDAIESLQRYLVHNKSDQDAAELLAELSPASKEEPSALPTSTLAEIYYDQGELEEAIKIYEQVVKSSPANEKSISRLNELKQIKEDQDRKKTKEEIAQKKRLRLIGILEKWLAAIEQRNLETVN